MAPQDIEFFSDNFMRGIAWYRAWFAGWRGESAVGEASPGYLMLRYAPRVVAARIDGMLPESRLLALLRNPIDRAHAAFSAHMARGLVHSGANLVDYVRKVPPESDPLSIVSGGWYARSLEPFVRRFGTRLLVLLQDEVKEDPGSVWRRAARHVGVDPSHLSDDLEYVPVPQLEDGFAASGRTRPRLDGRDRTVLLEYFLEDLADLERLLERSLPRWKTAEETNSAG
jgi:hypothetical protein